MAVFGQRVYLLSMKIMCVVIIVIWTLVFYYLVSGSANPAHLFYVHIRSIITFNL